MNAPTRILDTMTELHRFLFCSAHAGHGQWLSAALREAGVVLQEAGRPAQLQQRIGDLDPQVVLLEFSGEPTGHADDAPEGGIAQAVELAQMLKRVAPKLPLVAVGSMARADGMKAGAGSSYEKPGDTRILAHTKLIGGGESDSVTFDVSKIAAGGNYAYFCSFPGHWAMMKGTLKLGG